MDRFTELETFLAVVEAGGFTSAARRLGASQPAVSKAIGALENRLGVALFNRSTRKVTLTDQGRIYFDQMKPLLDEIEHVDSTLRDSAFDMSGSIRIAVPTTFGRLHVLPLIPKLLSTYPRLKLDLVLSDSVRDMVEDRIDLAIRIGAVEEPDAVVRRVASTPLVCVGSRQYFERHGVPQRPGDLAKHNCLIYEGFKGVANWPFVGPEGAFNVTVRGNLSSNSVETIRAGVLAGVGIGMFSRVSLVGELAHPEVVTILDDFLTDDRDVSFVWPKRRLVSARVRQVTDWLAAALLNQI